MRALKLTAIVVGVVVLAVGGVMLSAKLIQADLQSERAARSPPSAKAREAYLKDQRDFADHWLFRAAGDGDASKVLAARISWRGLEAPGPKVDSGVPERLADELREWGASFASHAEDADLSGADLTWMAELPRFGYWDLEAPGSPLATRRFDWAAAPLPDFLQVITVARARLLQGLQQPATLPAALGEVRALARLSATTETLIGVAVGASLVKLEAAAVAQARRNGLAPEVEAALAPLTPIATDEEAERMKRAVMAARAFFTVDPEEPTLADEVKLGRCAGLGEGLAGALLLRRYLEPEYGPRYARLTTLLDSSSCRLRGLRRAWNSDDGEGQLPVSAQALCGVEEARGARVSGSACRLGAPLVWVPGVRAAVGEVLLHVAEPSWSARYEAAPAAASNPAPTSPSPAHSRVPHP